MKKIALLFAFISIPLTTFAQGSFDSFENEKDVTSVVVTKNMFKLLSKMDLNSKDPEVKDYLKMVDNLETIKIFTTDNPDVAARMSAKVTSYVASNDELSELMRVKDEDTRMKIYVKATKNKAYVSEVLMFVNGAGKKSNKNVESVIISLTGRIDIQKISEITDTLVNESNEK